MIKQNSGLQYTIQQVSELTGLSKQVIRKWEERYGIIQPERLDNGYRVYSNEEVAKLLRMKELTETGLTIKQAISLLEEETYTNNYIPVYDKIEKTNQKQYTDQLIVQLLQEGAKGNDSHILSILKAAHHTIGVNDLIDHCIIPFLKEIGDRWYSGEWSEYQEAISSQTVRDFLANLRHDFHVAENAPIVIGSCLPNERHEIPIQILLIRFMLLGYKTIMLGPSPAPTAIQSTVRLKKPKIVLLSSITTLPFNDNFKMIKELDELASDYPNSKFFLGGYGAIQALKNQPLESIQLVTNLQEIVNDI